MSPFEKKQAAELKSRIDQYVADENTCAIWFAKKAMTIFDSAWEDWDKQGECFDPCLGIHTRISTPSLFIHSLVLRAKENHGYHLGAVETPDDVESLLAEFRGKFDADIALARELARRFPRLVQGASMPIEGESASDLLARR